MHEGAGDARGSYRNGKPEALKDSSTFRELYRTGKRYRGQAIRAVYARNTLGRIRLGFSVSRKTGGAVARNRFRRRVRELLRTLGGSVGTDVIISPGGSLKECSRSSLREDVEELLELLDRC